MCGLFLHCKVYIILSGECYSEFPRLLQIQESYTLDMLQFLTSNILSGGVMNKSIQLPGLKHTYLCIIYNGVSQI